MTRRGLCIDCNHSKPNADTEDDTIVLECHRYPPVCAGYDPEGVLELMWLQVNPDDFCGEYQPTARANHPTVRPLRGEPI